ncbi:MAG TPA: toll/interleukin-1 receptor domain-containing protein [Hyphomonadaceae bacterium]|nr:toll/interleukin-1 receptor domain-containing protein [Hyphomonadaceae bacterium]
MAGVAEESLKVFVSYSRVDKAFAADLVLGLTACGFEPYIDREDIAAGEVWEKRLEGLISEADTIVYVISPESVASKQCSWELATSLRLSKRVLPVVWRPVDDSATPADLAKLNYIFFSGEARTFAAGLAELAQALRVDIGWIREHTRLGELAGRWQARGRPETMLLRGDDIDAAISWRNAKPMGATAITDGQADFIKASADARAEAERKATAARRGLLTAVSAVALVFAGLAGVAAWQWQSAAKAEGAAKASRDDAVAAKDSLESANMLLGAPVALQAAQREDRLALPPGWFQIAAQFSGAAARLERLNAEGKAEGYSGFVIEGDLIHPRYKGEALLLTPKLLPRVAPEPGSPPQGAQTTLLDPTTSKATDKPSVFFPALAREGEAAPGLSGTEMVWATPVEMGAVKPFELWRLSGPLPKGARALKAEDIDCSPLGMGGGDAAGSRVPYAMYGVRIDNTDATKNGVTLFLSERVDRADPYGIEYTWSTSGGANGAMVFDLSTGKAAAIHYGVGAQTRGIGIVGKGISLRLVLDMARQKVKDAQLGPVCPG